MKGHANIIGLQKAIDPEARYFRKYIPKEPKTFCEAAKIAHNAGAFVTINHPFKSESWRWESYDRADAQVKQIFLSRSREEAMKRFNEFKNIWEGKYPKQVYNLERKLNYLFTYFQYPKSIRRSIHSNNIIERMNKEIRRRIKVIDSIPTEESALKIIYLRVAELNEKWSHRVLNGYFKCKDELMEMFSKRYP